MDRFEMQAYTGAVIISSFWGKLVIDVSGMRYSGKLPALREHARDRIAGVIDRVKKSAELTAGGYFTMATRDGQEVKALLSEGFPMQASVGIEIETIEEIAQGEQARVNGTVFQGPGVIVRQSHLREISFVSLGADSETSAYKLAASAPVAASQGVRNMEDHIKKFENEVNHLVDSGRCANRTGAIVFLNNRAGELREHYVKAVNEADDNKSHEFTYVTGEPKNFPEAVNKMLGEGHEPREAVRLAAAKYPELYQARQRKLAELTKF